MSAIRTASTAATTALQTTGNASLSSIDTKLPSGLVVTAGKLQVELPAGGGGLTNTELRASAVPVSMTSTTITGSVAVTGPLTDAQIRATALPVSGSFFQATQPISGTVTVSNPTANPETGLAKDGTDITTPSPAMPAGGVGIRGWLSAIWTKLNASLAVTGTFWQATQPVSGTFFQTTQPVSLATAPTTPVTGTFWQATQPISLATLPVTNAGTFAAQATLAAETTKVIGTVNIAAAQSATANTATTTAAPTYVTGTTNPLSTTVGGALRTQIDNSPTVFLAAGTNNIGDVDVLTLPSLIAGTAIIGALVANQSINNAQVGGVATATGSGVVGTGVQRMVLATDVVLPALSEARAATLHVTATAAVNTAITATLPAPAAGLFHYITSVELVKLYSVLGVAAGAGVIITSTNLPAGTWTTEQAAGAIGTAPKVIAYNPTTPLRSAVAATATTFVAPAQLQTIWRWNISYFTAV